MMLLALVSSFTWYCAGVSPCHLFQYSRPIVEDSLCKWYTQEWFSQSHVSTSIQSWPFKDFEESWSTQCGDRGQVIICRVYRINYPSINQCYRCMESALEYVEAATPNPNNRLLILVYCSAISLLKHCVEFFNLSFNTFNSSMQGSMEPPGQIGLRATMWIQSCWSPLLVHIREILI
jgi:hypothetical protein